MDIDRDKDIKSDSEDKTLASLLKSKLRNIRDRTQPYIPVRIESRSVEIFIENVTCFLS